MKRLYIGGADGMELYELDAQGNLTHIDHTDLRRVMYFAQDAHRLLVLLRGEDNEDKQSYVIPYFPDPQGLAVDLAPAMRTGGTCGCYVSAVGGRVYAANYLSASVSVMEYDTDVTTCVVHEGSGPDEARQECPHPHCITPSPDGKYLIAVDLGNDCIITYDRNLEKVAECKVPAGLGPRHIVFSKRCAFVANELGSSISMLRYNAETGTFLHDTVIPSCKDDGKHTPNYPAAIRVDDDYLYVSNRGRDCISVFRIAGEGALLAWVADLPCGGAWPRDFVVLGDYIVCCNEKSDSVTVLKLNETRTSARQVAMAGEIPAPIAVLAWENV